LPRIGEYGFFKKNLAMSACSNLKPGVRCSQ
jgi:hypothetical protein